MTPYPQPQNEWQQRSYVEAFMRAYVFQHVLRHQSGITARLMRSTALSTDHLGVFR